MPSTSRSITYLADCLHSIQELRRIEQELKEYKKRYPKEYALEQKQKFSKLLDEANNALYELLHQEDFAEYIKSKIHSEKFLLLVKDDRVIHLGPRFALTQKSPGVITLVACNVEISGKVYFIDRSDDETFLSELGSCNAPEYLVRLIVDALGEP